MEPSQIQKSLCFSFVGKRFLFPSTSLSSKEQALLLLIRKVKEHGDQRKAVEQKKKKEMTVIQQWSRVLVPPWGVCITIWYAYWAVMQKLRSPHPPKWRMVTTYWPEAHRPQTNWKKKGDGYHSPNIIPLPHCQPIRRKSVSCNLHSKWCL